MLDQKGAIDEGVIVLVSLVVIIFLFIILPPHHTLGPISNFGVSTPTQVQTTQTSSSIGTSGTQSVSQANSSYKANIRIGKGNAAYSIEPKDEYITIENIGDGPVNISGWKLTNNKSNRVYYAGNQTVHYASDEVVIPQATGYISPSGSYSQTQNIVLKPRETAIVTTGSIGVQSPYKIVSFKENECSGYIESLPQYDFTPNLNMSCVSPSEEPGIQNFDRACKNFVGSLNSCTTPAFGQTNHYSSDSCDNCVNGQPAPSSQCLAFIKQHFSYEGCLAAHQNDADFSGNTWRVFLARKWELWDKEDEVISLYDQFGKLVDSTSY
jgi:hypothetical protein